MTNVRERQMRLKPSGDIWEAREMQEHLASHLVGDTKI